MELWRGVRRLPGSFAARLVLLLTFGLMMASLASLLVAERARVQTFERMQLDRVVDSTADIVNRYVHAPARTAELLRTDRILGARSAPPGWPAMHADPRLDRLLGSRLGPGPQAHGMAMSHEQCFPNFDLADRAAGVASTSLPQCWFVTFRDKNGAVQRLSIDLMPFRLPPSWTLEPVSLALVLVLSVALSVVAARLATKPLRRLTQAAQTFSVTIDPEPIPEQGPHEVRAALATFNLMQRRVREGFRERTQILAAVTHDLQTPLTRLRLRLEQVGDSALRERLVGDLAVTQKLVRDGLDLARSSESREPWSVVDIDSILSSVAEDAAEFGWNVRVTSTCGAQLRLKPNALVRCLNNLIHNAISYAGDAELHCQQEPESLVIIIRDHGPGIPEDALVGVLEPFRRLQPGGSRPQAGSGLGLAIALAQARTFGADVTLHNHGTGLDACVRIPAKNA